MFVSEVLSKTLPFKWIKDSPIEMVAEFSSLGKVFHVIFSSNSYLEPGMYYLTFHQAADPVDHMTGTGGQFEVMSTVGAIIEQLVKAGTVQGLVFAGRREPSRILLYDRLAKLMCQKFGWVLIERDDESRPSQVQWVVGERKYQVDNAA